MNDYVIPQPRLTVHLNIAKRTRWPNDEIPACDGPGDTDTDYYTEDLQHVTCERCKLALCEQAA